MLNPLFIQHIEKELGQNLNWTVAVGACRQVAGGDINTTYIIDTGAGQFFLKVNTAKHAGMLHKEKEGLLLLRWANTPLIVPQPLLQGEYASHSYLLMECLKEVPATPHFWQYLGGGLAQLHQNKADQFGLPYNNFIGTLPQQNTPCATWAQFYTGQRIMPLLRMAFDRQLCNRTDLQAGEAFCYRAEHLMPPEPPALLHGDLWNGNCMAVAGGGAAVYDPSVYYGHREMDIAMTLLFGGFSPLFYESYHEVYPLEKNWQQRVEIFQLYPLLVHLLLFGSAYYGRVKSILKKWS